MISSKRNPRVFTMIIGLLLSIASVSVLSSPTTQLGALTIQSVVARSYLDRADTKSMLERAPRRLTGAGTNIGAAVLEIDDLSAQTGKRNIGANNLDSAAFSSSMSRNVFDCSDVSVETSSLVVANIEIMAGSNQKWEQHHETGQLKWEGASLDKDGRVIDYLGYPANYGYIPKTLSAVANNGDGDALDVLVLGNQLSRGESIAVRPLAVLRLLDQGEVDDKFLATQMVGPFSTVSSMRELREMYPDALEIISLWFGNYKRKGGVQMLGWEDEIAAKRLIAAGTCEYLRRESSKVKALG